MISLPKRKLELIRTLVKSGPLHMRAIISRAKISPTMAVKYVNELSSLGILKEIETGTKNVRKIDINYESDLALHAVAEVCIMEREEFVERHPDIRLLFRQIQKMKEIAFALVFGSHARGVESPESDIDMLVVSKGKRKLSRETFREELNLIEDKKVSFMFETESEFRQKKDDAIHQSIRQSFIVVKNPIGYLLAAL